MILLFGIYSLAIKIINCPKRIDVFARKLQLNIRFPIHWSPIRSNPFLETEPIPLLIPQPTRAQVGMVTQRVNGQIWYETRNLTFCHKCSRVRGQALIWLLATSIVPPHSLFPTCRPSPTTLENWFRGGEGEGRIDLKLPPLLKADTERGEQESSLTLNSRAFPALPLTKGNDNEK